MLTDKEKAKLMKAVDIINQKNTNDDVEYSSINTEEIVANAFKNLQNKKNKEV